MNKTGVLCFSLKWASPLLWAHYADKHKGICLGFDVPNEVARTVEYRETRLPFPKDEGELDEDWAKSWLYTKFSGWEYEEEVRVWATRDEEENRNYFADFDHNKMTLRKVIVGYRCCTERGSILALLTHPLYSERVEVIKARPAYDSFLIVADEQGFST
ncbi:MAG: DUF2971 domain-containing protein [Acidobacteria bacterium]|nr:DUF2971 domain-containing protein [Acidobacteriota bacterium]